MNICIQMGRLTRDPEVSYSGNGTAVARFSLAVDRRFKRENEPDTDFFNYVAFGKQAEFVEKYLHQGSKVVVSSRVQNDKYKNKDGVDVTVAKFYADTIEFAESKATSDRAANVTKDDGFMDIPDGIDEELPFN